MLSDAGQEEPFDELSAWIFHADPAQPKEKPTWKSPQGAGGTITENGFVFHFHQIVEEVVPVSWFGASKRMNLL